MVHTIFIRLINLLIQWQFTILSSTPHLCVFVIALASVDLRAIYFVAHFELEQFYAAFGGRNVVPGYMPTHISVSGPIFRLIQEQFAIVFDSLKSIWQLVPTSSQFHDAEKKNIIEFIKKNTIAMEQYFAVTRTDCSTDCRITKKKQCKKGGPLPLVQNGSRIHLHLPRCCEQVSALCPNFIVHLYVGCRRRVWRNVKYLYRKGRKISFLTKKQLILNQYFETISKASVDCG